MKIGTAGLIIIIVLVVIVLVGASFGFYQMGRNQGIEIGEKTGMARGLIAGEKLGYQKGYNEGKRRARNLAMTGATRDCRR
jgi:flagellar basal body-associated protein FliL